MYILRQNIGIGAIMLWGLAAGLCFGQGSTYVAPRSDFAELNSPPSPALLFKPHDLEIKRLPTAENLFESSLYPEPSAEFANEGIVVGDRPSKVPATDGGMISGMMGDDGGQGIGFEYNFLPGGGKNGFGLHQTRFNFGFMLPMRRMPPLMISGQFGASFLDAPEVLELPSQVYLTSVGIGMPLPISERMMVILSSKLRMSGEFNANQLQYTFMSMGTFRLSDRTTLIGGGGFKLLCDISDVDAKEFEPIVMAIGQFRRSENLSFIAGAAYLGSDSPWPLMPILGLNWTPRDDLCVALVMPSPRIAYRIVQRGENEEWWTYLGGRLGGDYWYLERPDGVVRAVRYSQFTLALGLERKLNDGISGSLEAGYAFARSIEIDDENIDDKLDSTLSVRLSIRR